MDSKSEAVGEYSIQRTSSRRFNRLLVSVGVPSRRCSRRRRLAVLLTYGSEGDSPRKAKTAGAAGVAANTLLSWSGTNSIRSDSTQTLLTTEWHGGSRKKLLD